MPDLVIVLIIVLVLVLIWRGPKTLPELGQALGRGVKEARKEAADIRSTSDADAPTDPEAAPAASSEQAPPAPPAT